MSPAELAEIARQLRETLPGLIAETQPAVASPPLRDAVPPRRPPPREATANRVAVARFAAGMLVPGLVVVAIALVRDLLG